MYVISHEREAIVVDPYWDEEIKRFFLQNFDTVKYVLLTHEHYDHISGVNSLSNYYHSSVVCSEICSNRIIDPALNLSSYFEDYCSLQMGECIQEGLEVGEYRCSASQTFQGHTEISWKGHKLFLRETPGHSPGSICILMDERVLFSGDTLLLEHSMVSRSPGGSKKKFLKETLPFLLNLPSECLVYPGHYQSFRLSQHSIYVNRSSAQQ